MNDENFFNKVFCEAGLSIKLEKCFNKAYKDFLILKRTNINGLADYIDWYIDRHGISNRFFYLDIFRTEYIVACTSYRSEHKSAIKYNIVPLEIILKEEETAYTNTFYFDCDVCINNFPMTYKDYLKQYELVKMKLL